MVVQDDSKARVIHLYLSKAADDCSGIRNRMRGSGLDDGYRSAGKLQANRTKVKFKHRGEKM